MSMFLLYNAVGCAIGVGVLIGWNVKKKRRNEQTYEEHILEDNSKAKRIEIIFGK